MRDFNSEGQAPESENAPNHYYYRWAMKIIVDPTQHTRSEVFNALDTCREALAGQYGPDVIYTREEVTT